MEMQSEPQRKRRLQCHKEFFGKLSEHCEYQTLNRQIKNENDEYFIFVEKKWKKIQYKK